MEARGHRHLAMKTILTLAFLAAYVLWTIAF
jgi:hypothetical protein